MMVYQFGASGATVQFHYCMGALNDVQIALATTEANNCCDESEETNENGCCENEELIIAIDDDGAAAPVFAVSTAAAVSTVPRLYQPEMLVVAAQNKGYHGGNGSPPLPVPLFLRFCHFRI